MCKQCDAKPQLTHEHDQSASHEITEGHNCARGKYARRKPGAVLATVTDGVRTAHFTCECGIVRHQQLQPLPEGSPR